MTDNKVMNNEGVFATTVEEVAVSAVNVSVAAFKSPAVVVSDGLTCCRRRIKEGRDRRIISKKRKRNTG
jgi:hypothetical protein